MSEFSETFRNAKGQVIQELDHNKLMDTADETAGKLSDILLNLKNLLPEMDMDFYVIANTNDRMSGEHPEKLQRKTDYVQLKIRTRNISSFQPEDTYNESDNFHAALREANIEVIQSNEQTKKLNGKVQEQILRYKLAVPIDDNPDQHHVMQVEIHQDNMDHHLKAPDAQWTAKDEEKLRDSYKKSQARTSTAAKIARALCRDIKIDYYNEESCLIADPKSISRRKEKALTEYDGNLGKIKDGTRLMLLFEDAKAVCDIRKLVKSQNSNLNQYLGKKELEIYDSKDLFETPKELGYMAYLMWIRPIGAQDNSESIEIQITQKDLQLHYYPKTHNIYEKHRPQIETYRQDNVPLSQWDDDTKSAAYEIRRLHFEGAQDTGVINYVTYWPFNENDQVERYKEDVPPVKYTSFDKVDKPLRNFCRREDDAPCFQVPDLD